MAENKIQVGFDIAREEQSVRARAHKNVEIRPSLEEGQEPDTDEETEEEAVES